MKLIKILAESRQEKGKQFEGLMMKILDRMGYTDFRSRIYKTGVELDLKAWHKVTREPILCQCKAHKDSISSKPLRLSYGDYTKERKREDRLVGLFFSLSGFNSTALEWYDELDSTTKETFRIFQLQQILNLLRDSGMLVSDDLIIHKLETLGCFNLAERYIVYFNNAIYCIQLIPLVNEQKYGFNVVNDKGNIVSKLICNQIKNQDDELKDKELINLQAREKVILNLLDGKSKSIEQISSEIIESKTDIELAIKRLTAEAIVKMIDNTYKIAYELTTFLSLAKQFLYGEHRSKFISSNYAEEIINDALLNYIKDRFRLDIPNGLKSHILNLIRISPSALREALFSSIDRYVTSDEHLTRLKMSPEELKKWRASFINSFLELLLGQFLVDHYSHRLRRKIHEEEIKGYQIGINLKVATLRNLFLSLHTESVIMSAKLAEGVSVRGGELMSFTDPAIFIEFGDVLSNMGEFEKALQEFDRAIKSVKDENKLKVAWNNKGVCYLRMGNKDNEAISCFDKALEYDTGLKEAWYNKGCILKKLGKPKEAKICIQKAIDIDPDYVDAKQLLEEM